MKTPEIISIAVIALLVAIVLTVLVAMPTVKSKPTSNVKHNRIFF